MEIKLVATPGEAMEMRRTCRWAAGAIALGTGSAVFAALDPIFSNSFEYGLIGFGPALSALPQGATAAASAPVALRVTLDQPAAAPTFVPIGSSDPARLQAAGGGTTVPSGQTSALVLLDAIAAGATPVVLWASYGNTLGASVRIEQALNESGAVGEADNCVLQFPATIAVVAGQATPSIYGRLYEAGTTEAAGAPPGWQAEIGYGPGSSDPRLLAGWHFVAATYNTQIGNDDEFQATLVAPDAPGPYSYTVRFTQDSGGRWTYCDLNGAGSNAGADFQLTALGSMNVVSPYAGLVINEIDYDNVGTDAAEFLEIYNAGTQSVDLTGAALVLVNGASNNGAEYGRVDLAPMGILNAGQYGVVGASAIIGALPAGTASIDLGSSGNLIQNGAPDGVALISVPGAFVIDALSYEGSITAANPAGFGTPVNLVEGTPLPVTVQDSNTMPGSLVRLPNGADANNATADWNFTTLATPGAANTP